MMGCLPLRIYSLFQSKPRQAKICLRACGKCTYSDTTHACAKFDPGICFPLLHSIVSNDSVSGQRRPRSDCADAQAHD